MRSCFESDARVQVGKSVDKGNLTLISMGQGQEGPAEAVLDRYIKDGGWVFLDNVHLMQVCASHKRRSRVRI
jgi:hypothetical protein